MAVASLRQDGVLFAPDMPPEVDEILQEAVVLYNDTERAEQTLWQAHDMAPDRLEVYVALYKFYFYKNRLGDAEKVVLQSLQKAAEMGGFEADWQQLNPQSTLWTPAPPAQRAYLYSLKALAFINLRLEKNARAAEILSTLHQLDPEDQVGGSVIADLLAAMTIAEA